MVRVIISDEPSYIEASTNIGDVYLPREASDGVTMYRLIKDKRLRDAVLKFQWSDSFYGEHDMCPGCKQLRPHVMEACEIPLKKHGHKAGCSVDGMCQQADAARIEASREKTLISYAKRATSAKRSKRRSNEQT